MPNLKSNLHFHLKKHHLGRDRAVTIRELFGEMFPFEVFTPNEDRKIRIAIRELNMENVPILTGVHKPYGIWYASSESEFDEYFANLGSRAKAIHERMAALNKAKAKEFLKGQLSLFG